MGVARAPGHGSGGAGGLSIRRSETRSAEVDRVIGELGRGQGVVVRGPYGPEARAVIGDVVRGLDAGSEVVVVPEAGSVTSERVGDLLRRLDDGRRPLLSATSSKAALPPAVAHLVDIGRVTSITLAPVMPADARRAVAAALGAAPGDDVAAVLVPRRMVLSVSLLLAAADHALAHGVVEVDAGGRARFVSEWRPDDRVRNAILDDVRAAGSHATETAVDLLALAPGLTDHALESILGRLSDVSAVDELERLERLGVAVVRTDSGRLVLWLVDGAIELLLPPTLGPLSRRRLTSAIVDHLSSRDVGSLTTGELVALGRYSIELERTATSGLLTRAARASLRLPDTAVSLGLAQAAVETDGGFDSHLALAAAEIQVGRTENAIARLQRLITAADDVQVVEAVNELIRHAIERGGSTTVLGRMLDSSRDTDARGRAAQAKILHALGDLVGASEQMEPVLDELEGEDLVLGHFIVAAGSVVTGRLERARLSLDAAEEIVVSQQGDVSRIHWLRATLATFDGRIDQAIVSVRKSKDMVAGLGIPGAEAMLGWSLGTLLNFSGRHGEAISVLDRSCEAMEASGLLRTAMLVRTEMAIAFAGMGRTVEAADRLAPAAAVVADGEDTAPALDAKVLNAEGWILACSGRTLDAGERLLRAAEVYQAGGMSHAAALSLIDAARMGRAEEASNALGRFAVRVEGRLVQAGVRYVGLLVERDDRLLHGQAGERGDAADLAARLESVAVELADVGSHATAAEAWDRARRVHQLGGAERDSVLAARRRDEQLAVCGLDGLPWLIGERVRALSAREGEIADLAAAGMSNREISERLVLSIRTVETHLLRVYQKLGIRRRGELSEALVGAPRAAVEDA